MALMMSGDLAYVVGFEHIANSVVGVPVEPDTLRVTHVFRREHGEWKIAHRHADYVPIDQTLGSKVVVLGLNEGRLRQTRRRTEYVAPTRFAEACSWATRQGQEESRMVPEVKFPKLVR
jgi:hypothetical protein